MFTNLAYLFFNELGTNVTLLIDYCVDYYCGLLFSIKYTFVNECFYSLGTNVFIATFHTAWAVESLHIHKHKPS